jgi:hypothetical protein
MRETAGKYPVLRGVLLTLLGTIFLDLIGLSLVAGGVGAGAWVALLGGFVSAWVAHAPGRRGGLTAAGVAITNVFVSFIAALYVALETGQIQFG